MAALDNINTSISNIAAQIASITASPSPTYSVQGVSISMADYLAMLTKQMAELQEVAIFLSGPYQFVTVGVS